MKNRLFWKLGLLYLLMLLLAVGTLGVYVVRAIRQEYLDAAYMQLESVSQVALLGIPSPPGQPDLRERAGRLAQKGIRVTVVSADGIVLADSEQDPSNMENHARRPEILEAFATGTGRAVRHSTTLGRDMVYLARRYSHGGATDFVMRFSIPLQTLDAMASAFRSRLGLISLAILALAGGVSLLFFRTISGRIQRLKEFSLRVAEGDFRPLPRDRHRDELSDLAGSLNRTAGELDRTIRTLTEERNQSAAILASMEEGVVVIGRDQSVLYCNRAFCQAMEAPGTGWHGKPVLELIRHPDLVRCIRNALALDTPIHGEVVVGSVRTRSYAVTAAPVRPESTASGAVMVLHDISEIRRLERVRRDFIANISHEFKTPLTAIQGFAETLLDGAVEDAGNRGRFLGIIRDHALRLGRLTEDLLKLARIEAGQLSYDARLVPFSEIVAPCLDTARVKAKEKKLHLEAVYPEDLPRLFGDVRSFQEILGNLLDNAVRYSSAGGTIRVQASAASGEIVIAVSDDGIGIPQVDQERIFERFYRTDAARSRESGGTGLGLAIVKHHVEAQGGRVRVESEVGTGSTFYVHLPIRAEPGSSA